MKRRTLIASSLAGVVGTFATRAAYPQAFPRKPVRIVVPFPAGGSNDLIARAISDRLAARIGQPVIIESKPGASGSIGTDLVAKSEPDGHTLLLGSLPTAVAPSLMKTPWDPVKDFVGVAYLGVTPNIVAVHPSLGVDDLKGLVALAKQKPGQINYVNPGNGTSPHLGAEVFQFVNQVKFVPVMYKGAPPSITDFVAGEVPVGFYPFGVIVGMVRSGRAKAIALASPVRTKLLPDVPTMTEQGFESNRLLQRGGAIAAGCIDGHAGAQEQLHCLQVTRACARDESLGVVGHAHLHDLDPGLLWRRRKLQVSPRARGHRHRHGNYGPRCRTLQEPAHAPPPPWLQQFNQTRNVAVETPVADVHRRALRQCTQFSGQILGPRHRRSLKQHRNDASVALQRRHEFDAHRIVLVGQTPAPVGVGCA